MNQHLIRVFLWLYRGKKGRYKEAYFIGWRGFFVICLLFQMTNLKNALGVAANWNCLQTLYFYKSIIGIDIKAEALLCVLKGKETEKACCLLFNHILSLKMLDITKT